MSDHGAVTGALRASVRVVPPASAQEIYRVMREHRLNPLVSNAVITRNLSGSLRPEVKLAPIPKLMDAAERIKRAIAAQERITVFGDYDADGVTSVSVLALGLSELGAVVQWVVPERLTDGYGLTEQFIPDLLSSSDLLITVDTGITAVDTVAALRSAGVDVIITDHHTIQESLPDTLVIHPALADENLGLTGAGVAWHLLWATRIACGETSMPTWLSDYAAIGTIADVAELTTWNRALIQLGLRTMTDSEHPSIRLLTEDARGTIGSTFVGFNVAPLLNAAGRLGVARTAVGFLLERDHALASGTLGDLRALNQRRKDLTEVVTKEALMLAGQSEQPVVVLENPEWHPGVIGIAAARILEVTGKSAFLSSGGKGSVRVASGHHALEALQFAQTHLTAFGGHEKAAGYTLADASDVTAFEAMLCAYAKRHPSAAPVISVDGILHPDGIDEDDTTQLHTLEPHGPRNPSLTYGLVGQVKEVRGFGKGNPHTRIKLFTEGVIHGGVLWNKRPEAFGVIGSEVTLIGEISRNEWNDRVTIELSGRHITPPPTVSVASFIHRNADGGSIRLTELPVNPTKAAAALKDATRRIVRLRETNSDAFLTLSLSDENLFALECAARALPRVSDVRVRKRSGAANSVGFEVVDRILVELGDAEPTSDALYGNATFSAVALTRFVILNFVAAFRHLDALAFEEHLVHSFA